MNLSLQNLSKTDVAVPTYDRKKLTPGIVHIGVGNFHRAHLAWYQHRLFTLGMNLDWAIIGAGVRDYDKQMRARLKAQSFLTTLIELEPSGISAEIVGSMIDYVPIEQENTALIQQLIDPAIRIVSLTVTEGGYFIDPSTRAFDSNHPDITHDAAKPEAPRTAFGAIVAALRKRKDSNTGAFTCLSCDNLQNNGRILRQVVVSLARLSDPQLADWIDSNCSFPNSVVDCIVPATVAREYELARQFGVDDAVPVTHEKFRQWIIEDDFCAGRPDWDIAGAVFSNRIHKYEKMKIRMLNGGHQILAATGELLSIESIAQAMADARVHALFTKIEEKEIMPHVQAVPEFTPQHYLALLDKRLSNTAIIDTTRRVAFDGSSRQPGFLLPSVHDSLSADISVEGLALVSAIWARYCLGEREDDSIIEANDPHWGELQQRARQAKTQPQIWLDNKKVYGSLSKETRFAQPFEYWLAMIYNRGLEATIDSYLADTSQLS